MRTQNIASHQIFGSKPLDLSGLDTLQSMQVVGVSSSDQDESARFEEWKRERLGKITGSQFDRIKRDKSGKGWSVGAETYLNELIWEHATGTPASSFQGSRQTEWGEANEAQARKIYEEKMGISVSHGDFFKLEGFLLVGCTPDGYGKRGLEIKSPWSCSPHFYTIRKRKVPKQYQDQVQGHILCLKTDYCDFVSFDPRLLDSYYKNLSHIIIEVEKNSSIQDELSNRLYDFEEELIRQLDELEIDWRGNLKKWNS
jgi:YqaJ-like viral recombinase domain